jgi:prepilin-type N-terminal cleavage/methylation domain-containing protein
MPRGCPFFTLHSAIRNLRSRSAFTLIEMLVVLGIIALVTAMTLPMIIPMMRTRTLDSAVDIAKSACILARSTAIQQRKTINLTFLQQTDATHGPGIVLTDYGFAGAVTSGGTAGYVYDSNQNWVANSFQYQQILLFSTGTSAPQIRKIQSNTSNTITIYEQGGAAYNPSDPNDPNESGWSPAPAVENVYVILSAISSSQPYCIHNPNNYGNGPLANNDVRFLVLKTFSQYMGETLQYLPTGCQFNFPTDSTTSPVGAWTYVFLPDGEAWTLLPSATNTRDTNWVLTTYMVNGAVSGPKIWGPNNLTSSTISVYATTGQVISQ